MAFPRSQPPTYPGGKRQTRARISAVLRTRQRRTAVATALKRNGLVAVASVQIARSGRALTMHYFGLDTL